MTLKRMDNVGIVVESLDAVIPFFVIYPPCSDDEPEPECHGASAWLFETP